MGERIYFALFINHGGTFVVEENRKHYVGGDFVEILGLDHTKFSYTELADLVKKLGYVSWTRLWYEMPKTNSYFVMSDNTDVMNMLEFLKEYEKINVFVEDGLSLADALADNMTWDDGSGVLENVVQNVVRNDVSFGEGNTGDLDVNGNMSTGEDIDYGPSEDELSQVSQGDLDYISDEEFVQSRLKLSELNNVFDLVDKNVENVDIDLGGPKVSDNEDSDGYGDSSDTDEEGDGIRYKKDRIEYDPKCNHKDMQLVLGMHFEDGYQCRDALKTWAIENGRFIHFRKVSKTECLAKCNPPCKWRIHASIVRGDETFIIKSYGGDHDCPRSMDNKLVSSKWIAKKYLNLFRVRYNLSVAELRADILQRFKTYVTKDRLYKAKRIAQELVRGTVEAHYASLRRYLAELRRVDKEGRFELLLGEGAVFKGLYLGFSSLRKGFLSSCRKVVGLDGCFLKTYMGGVLLCAVGKDGNHEMYPIAWAIVEIENEECWTWFLKCFIEDLGITEGNSWTFVSDQQKGLQNAVSKLAPYVEHRNCARHVCMNWRKHHKGTTLRNMFWRAVKATYVEEFKVAIQAMKEESAAAFEDFMARDVNKFCKAFISTSTFSDMIDNNISETFNGHILNARGKHVIHMCEDIRLSMMVRQSTNFKSMSLVKDRICPRIRKILEQLRRESIHCFPNPSGLVKFEVYIEGDKFVVDTMTHSCSCRVWDLTGIPCIHAISAIHFLQRDPAEFVNDYYNVAKYLEGYQFFLEPIKGEKMWPEVDGLTVNPPTVKKMPGRPKKKRRRHPVEVNPHKLSRHGVRMTCTNCGQQGHNSRGCKKEKVPKAPKEKGKRGRPANTNANQKAPSKGKQPCSTSTEAPSKGKKPCSTSKKAPSKGKQPCSTSKKAPSKGKQPCSTSDKATIARERAFSRKGSGIYINEGNGNTYFHPNTSHRSVIQVTNKEKNPCGASPSWTPASNVTQDPTTREYK